MTENIRNRNVSISNKEKVINFLKKFKDRKFIVNRIAFELELDRHTITKYLLILRDDGLASFDKMATCKLWYYKKGGK